MHGLMFRLCSFLDTRLSCSLSAIFCICAINLVWYKLTEPEDPADPTLRRLTFIMCLSFAQYATPASFAAFSASHFSFMTFEQVTDLAYPKIAAPNSVVSWCYSENVPANAEGTIVTLRDTIPHATDLQPILHDMEVAFGNGMRSVVMTIKLAEAESQNTYEYHFAKVCQLQIAVMVVAH
jgi:hypothetical protein